MRSSTQEKTHAPRYVHWGCTHLPSNVGVISLTNGDMTSILLDSNHVLLTTSVLDNAPSVNDHSRTIRVISSRLSNKFDLLVEDANQLPIVSTEAHHLFHHHLRSFYHHWSTITTDRWVLKVVQSGLSIPFLSIPSTTPPSPSLFRDPSHEKLLEQEVQRLLTIGAIEGVPKQFWGKGFYSRYFLIPKKSGGWRPILDLRKLNRHLRRQRFKMVTLSTILPSLNKKDWFAVLDLQDAYFHVEIHVAHRRFLRFRLGSEHYQYRVLPFGLACAPRVFTKMLAVVAAHLRRLGVTIFPYLDDCLLRGTTYMETYHMVRTVSDEYATLGLLINLKKSTLVPSQNLMFIGARLDSAMARAYLPMERFIIIKELIHTVVHAPTIPTRVCLQLLGHMAAATIVVYNARLRFRCLQHWLATVYIPSRHSVHRPVVVPQYVRESLQWWTNPTNLLTGVPFHRPQPTIQITTDASLIGWGTHMGNSTVQGRWLPREMLLHINLLELRAVRHACKHFQSHIQNTTTRILTDNMATMFYINKQGGARSRSLCAESIRLWNWCIANNTVQTASYLPGIDNLVADSLSRRFPHDHEWEIRTDVLNRIFARWGFPTIDLFATELNLKCPNYCSRAGIGQHSLGDAFLLHWGMAVLYAFPPTVLIPRVLEKINVDKARVILLVPAWARQPWFSMLYQMSVKTPYPLPSLPNLLTQDNGSLSHPRPEVLHLTAWMLAGLPTPSNPALGESNKC
nr:uncharacterized protein LOC112547415 [Pelodiscus sinensis]|eukprot:XP_025045344.1 uncharacterized protein LOC112547415 [Pelodiscus sinensis]